MKHNEESRIVSVKFGNVEIESNSFDMEFDPDKHSECSNDRKRFISLGIKPTSFALTEPYMQLITIDIKPDGLLIRNKGTSSQLSCPSLFIHHSQYPQVKTSDECSVRAVTQLPNGHTLMGSFESEFLTACMLVQTSMYSKQSE